MKIITNNQWREIIFGHELTPTERKEYDTLLDELDEQEFFRYRGHVYYLGDFMNLHNKVYTSSWQEDTFKGWDGIGHQSYDSGVLVKLGEDGENVMVGRYY